MKKRLFKSVSVVAFLSLLAGLILAAEKAEQPMIEKPELPIITEAQSPIGTVTVLYARDAREAFFEQLRKFSDKHAFTIRIARIHPDYEDYDVSMWRTDIKVFGGITYNSISLTYPAEFRLHFYENSPHPVPAAHLDLLINDLKHFIGKIRGVTLIPQKN